MAVNATHVYWVNRSQTGAVFRVGIDGGSPVSLASASYPEDVVLDGSYLYWTVGGSGTDDGQVRRARQTQVFQQRAHVLSRRSPSGGTKEVALLTHCTEKTVQMNAP